MSPPASQPAFRRYSGTQRRQRLPLLHAVSEGEHRLLIPVVKTSVRGSRRKRSASARRTIVFSARACSFAAPDDRLRPRAAQARMIQQAAIIATAAARGIPTNQKHEYVVTLVT